MSTTTITKRADELKPGDVVELGVNGKCSFLYAERKAHEDKVRMEFGMHSGRGIVAVELDLAVCQVFKVESHALTPAQQHAEELLEVARAVIDPGVGLTDLTILARETLAKIDPLAPPTLEEALEALALLAPMCEGQATQSAFDLLDRARRSGVKV